MNGRALRLGCLLALVVLAGCSGFAGQSTDSSRRPQFDNISVSNEHDETHSVDIVVTENESVVYWTNVELNASYTSAGVEVAPGEYLTPSALGDRGEYVVLFRLDNRTGKRFAMREYLTDSCTDWFIKVMEDGRLNYGVGCR